MRTAKRGPCANHARTQCWKRRVKAMTTTPDSVIITPIIRFCDLPLFEKLRVVNTMLRLERANLYLMRSWLAGDPVLYNNMLPLTWYRRAQQIANISWYVCGDTMHAKRRAHYINRTDVYLDA